VWHADLSNYPRTKSRTAAEVGSPLAVETAVRSFAVRFRKIVGAAPMEYLTRWRMLLAADRLQSSADGLSAIAQSLGYKSESAFGKAFRRVMGCSPRQYTRIAPYAIPVKQVAEHHQQ